MARSMGFNEYEIVGDSVYIILRNRYKEFVAKTIIDLDELDYIKSLGLHFHAWWNFETYSYYARATEYLGVGSNRTWYLHKLISRKDNGATDHINGDTLNNRKDNLNPSTAESNSKNRNRINKNNKLGVRNVCYIDGRYVVQLQINGKNTRLGSFDDLEEASRFAEEMRQKHYKQEPIKIEKNYPMKE